jgi:hypothetical protein
MTDPTKDKDGKHINSADRKYAMTKQSSHRASMRGYAFGELIEPGQLVPAGIAVSTEWMEPVKGSRALAEAIDQAVDAHPDDVDLNAQSKPALEGLALSLEIDPAGLNKAELIAAITAKRADPI